MVPDGIDVLIKVKLLESDAKLPSKSYQYDSGYDLYAYHDELIPARCNANIYTGVAICAPPGWGYTIRGRSSLNKKGIQTSVGTVDAEFSGPIYALLFNTIDEDYMVKSGDRVAQIVFERIYNTEFKLVEQFDLPLSARGGSGFGSSGK